MRYSNKQVEVRRTVEQDKPFPGKNLEQMPLLLGEERSPWSGARFMRERIEHSDEFPDLRSYLGVVPLVAYDSKKRSTNVKFVLAVDNKGRVTEKGRDALELINPNAKLTPDYAVSLSIELYDSLPGIVVPREKLGVLEKDMTEEEILDNKAWRIISGNSNEVPDEFVEGHNLLKDYVGWVKSHTKEGRNMGVYFDSNSDDAKLRAFYVYGLVSRSGLDGGVRLDDGGGRLVGYLASETPGARVNDDERAVRKYTEEDVAPR